jgi:hypothetical protein
VRGLFQRRLWVLLLSAATAYAVWKYVPGSECDRKAFTALAEISTQPALPVSGKGTHQSPWSLGEILTREKTSLPADPAIISLGDDVEGFFQSSPPAPIDLSVVLANAQRVGLKKAAIAMVMAWENPDTIALAALEKKLGSFESLMMAAPLSRGAVPEAMPPAFRRASLPLTSIEGDSSVLPTVNRIPISGIILGGETATAGFSILESDRSANGGFHPLIARWGDRAVFSFPLLVVLQQLNLPLDGVKILLGKSITLGPAGPTLKIDEFGRIAVPMQPMQKPLVAAQLLIDGDANLFPNPLPEIFILRDDQSAAESSTRAFSENLTAVMAAIATDKEPDPPRLYQRLPQERELGLLGVLVILFVTFSNKSLGFRFFSVALFFVACAVAQWLAFRNASLWLPGLATAASAMVAFIAALLFPTGKKEAEPAVKPEEAIARIPLEDHPLPEIPVIIKNSPQTESLRKVPAMPALSNDKTKKKSTTDRP